MNEITAEYVRDRLDYDPETGVFLWRNSEAMPRHWNARWAGTVAGNIDSDGYQRIMIDGSHYLAHRLAWLITTGERHHADIDHINGIRNDNRLANLRSVSRTENLRNQAMRSDNTSGHMGVCWDKQRGKWRAVIRVDGRDIYLGRFDNVAGAIAARAAAETAHGFHPNHGRRHDAR